MSAMEGRKISTEELVRKKLGYREDAVSKMRSYSKITFGILFLIMLLLMLNGIWNAHPTMEPLYFPISSFIYVLLTFLVIFNVVICIFDALELKYIEDFKTKIWRADDYIINARPIIVVAIIFIILFSYQPLLKIIEDASSNKDEERIGAYSYHALKFYPTDGLEMSYMDYIDVKTDGGRVNVSIIEKEHVEDCKKYDFDATEQKIHEYFKAHVGDTIDGKIDVALLDLPYKEHVALIYNPGEDDVVVNYVAYNSLNKVLLRDIVYYCTAILLINIIWSVLVYAIKRSFIREFVRREEEKLLKKYTVEEIFLIYKDGRLIAHNTRRLKPDIDKDILTGMLTAVQSFVRDSFKMEERGVLNELHYGKLKILIENGPYANLAVVVSGEEPETLRARMRKILNEVHAKYAIYLKNWDGDVGPFSRLKRELGRVIVGETAVLSSPVEDIFIFYRDTRFIMHVTKRMQPEVDDSLLYAALKKIQNEMEKSLLSSASSPIYDMPYGDWKVIIEYGVYVFMAVLISGREPPNLRGIMRRTLEEINTRYERILASWDGSTEQLTDIKQVLEMMIIETGISSKKT